MRYVLALALIAFAFALAAAARAQSGIEVHSSSATNDFPNGITLSLDASSDAPLDDVRLIYEIAPDGVLTTAEPDCSGDTAVSCRYQLGGSGQLLLIPGAEVTYSWRLTAGETTVESDPQTVTYEDSRFHWGSVSDGNLTVWYYGDEDDARAVLAAGRQSLDRTSALLQTTVDFPVKIRYYEFAKDMSEAIMSNNAQGVVTLGEVYYSDTAMVSADYSPQDIARHEIAHVVVRASVSGPFNIPDWLNEGLAVYSQSQPLADQRQAIENGIRTNHVLSVRSLSSASAGALGSDVSLFYGQSWSIVKFLIETYGDAKFADLFRAYDAGASTAHALEQVYGFNQDGLENAWRASVGLPPRTAPTPDGSSAVEPTQPPPADAGAANGGAGGGGDGTPVALIAVIAVLTVALAGGLLGAGVVIARRYR